MQEEIALAIIAALRKSAAVEDWAAAVMPLVKRAQADAVRKARAEGPKKYYALDGYGHVGAAVPVEWLDALADRIEKEAGA